MKTYISAIEHNAIYLALLLVELLVEKRTIVIFDANFKEYIAVFSV